MPVPVSCSARIAAVEQFNSGMDFVFDNDIEVRSTQHLPIPSEAKLIYERTVTNTAIWQHEGIVYKQCSATATQPNFRRQSRQEALMAMRLAPLVAYGSTPHVCLPVAWKRLADGGSLFLSEAADSTLHALLHDGRVPESTIFRLLYQVLWTLRVIRSQWPGFVHGDLHSGNVFVRRESRHSDVQYADDARFTDCEHQALIADCFFAETKSSTRGPSFDHLFLMDALLSSMRDSDACRAIRPRLFLVLDELVPERCRYRASAREPHDRVGRRAMARHVDDPRAVEAAILANADASPCVANHPQRYSGQRLARLLSDG